MDRAVRLDEGGRRPSALIPEIVQTLNGVAPCDWRAFLTERLNVTSARAPLGGITNGGWRVVWADTAADFYVTGERARKNVDERYTVGLLLGDDGAITDFVPGLAAARAGIGPGMKLVAVNGRGWTKSVLRDAIRATRSLNQPLELMVRNGEFFKTCKLDYKGGGRYPALERDPSKPDLLSAIGTARPAGP